MNTPKSSKCLRLAYISLQQMCDFSTLLSRDGDLGAKRTIIHIADTCVRFEVDGIEASKLLTCAIVGILVRPRLARIQDLRVHTWERLGDVEAENWISSEFSFLDGAIKDRIDASTCRLDRHALTHTVCTAGPTCVDEECGRSVLIEFLLQQVAH